MLFSVQKRQVRLALAQGLHYTLQIIPMWLPFELRELVLWFAPPHCALALGSEHSVARRSARIITKKFSECHGSLTLNELCTIDKYFITHHFVQDAPLFVTFLTNFGPLRRSEVIGFLLASIDCRAMDAFQVLLHTYAHRYRLLTSVILVTIFRPGALDLLHYAFEYGFQHRDAVCGPWEDQIARFLDEVGNNFDYFGPKECGPNFETSVVFLKRYIDSAWLLGVLNKITSRSRISGYPYIQNLIARHFS